MQDHYDPNQPRIPVGHEGGGRWTRDPNAAGKRAFSRLLGFGQFGSGARGPFMPLPIPPFQRVPPRPPVAPVTPVAPPAAPMAPVVPPMPAEKDVQESTDIGFTPAADHALDAWVELSKRNTREKQAVITLYRVKNSLLDLESLSQVEREDFARSCPCSQFVQSLTDRAAVRVREKHEKDCQKTNPQKFGSAVHKELEESIKAAGIGRLSAEVSRVKTKEEGQPVTRGLQGSKRIDVCEIPRPSDRCIYDAKTGDADFTPARKKELAEACQRTGAQRLILTEVRPMKTEWTNDDNKKLDELKDKCLPADAREP